VSERGGGGTRGLNIVVVGIVIVLFIVCCKRVKWKEMGERDEKNVGMN
jgi:hypothetical protein